MGQSKLCIEVSVNEVVSRKEYPRVPYSPQEIAEEALRCVEAGASVVHIHARDPKTGEQRFQGVELYTEAMRLIMKESEAICYPTWPPRNEKLVGLDRFAHVFALARDSSVALHMMDVDTGVMLSGTYDPVKKQFNNPDHLYFGGSHMESIAVLKKLKEVGVKPRFGLRELGHIRHLEAFMDMGLIEERPIIKFVFKDDILYNLPPSAKAIQTFLDWLPEGLQCEWWVQSAGKNHHVVNNAAILLGGHVRTGIGDNLVYAGERLSTVQQVRRVVETAERMGREVATPREAREIHGLAPLKRDGRAAVRAAQEKAARGRV